MYAHSLPGQWLLSPLPGVAPIRQKRVACAQSGCSKYGGHLQCDYTAPSLFGKSGPDDC